VPSSDVKAWDLLYFGNNGQMILGPWTHSRIGANDVEIIHFGKESQCSSGNRLHNIYINTSIITDILSAASKKKVLTISWFNNKRSSLFLSQSISNSFTF